ncbi:MAG TPA: hypothetical protein VHK69_11815 [Chitinophagaceae bacterium]|jgi:hypothetical protein|nr:hypothetical protein [Chitinophagaceae bacterium]
MKTGTLAILLFSLSACRKDPPAQPVPAPVEKTATFQVFAAYDYSHPLFENRMAEVNLQVWKVNFRRPVPDEKLWDTTLSSRPVREYPLYDQKLQLSRNFAVLDGEEKLNVSYRIRYEEGGIRNYEVGSDEIIPGVRSLLLEVTL